MRWGKLHIVADFVAEKSLPVEICSNELRTGHQNSKFDRRQLIRWPKVRGGGCGRFACVGHRDFKSLNTRAAVGFACEFTARVDRRAVVGCDSLRARVSAAPQGCAPYLAHAFAMCQRAASKIYARPHEWRLWHLLFPTQQHTHTESILLLPFLCSAHF